MTNARKLGIWMDHATAHLMEFTADPIETTTIVSAFTHQEKEDSLGKSEELMHNKEQHEEADYYKKIGEVIRQYGEVILFGPTEAKHELWNKLRLDHRFSGIKIYVQSADKMTDNQQHAFVKKYFSEHVSAQ